MSAIVWNFDNDSGFWKYQYFCLKIKYYKKIPPAKVESFVVTFFNLN